jgi:hypothetical protein
LEAVFVSKGRLFLVTESGDTQEIESTFSRKHELLAEKRSSTSPWQADSQSGGMWGGFPLWGNRGPTTGLTRYQFADVVRGRGTSIYYALSGGSVTGLFEYDCTTGDERRLFHRNGFRFTGIDFDPEAGRFVIGRAREDGASDLELLSDEGRSLKMLTGGDSVDCHPSFSRRDTNAVVFQSCGIARNAEGHPVSFGPAAVNRIDIESGQMSELLCDDGFDYLLPREAGDGVLYAIRRPFEADLRQPAYKAILNFILFPFHFVGALYSFLRMFTEMYRNPPNLAGGPQPTSSKEQQYMDVLGRTIDLGKAGKTRRGEEPSLVPKTWELIRVPPGGKPEVVSAGVCAYDLDHENGVLLTNGYRIHRLTHDSHALVGKFDLIEKVTCRGAAPNAG